MHIQIHVTIYLLFIWSHILCRNHIMIIKHNHKSIIIICRESWSIYLLYIFTFHNTPPVLLLNATLGLQTHLFHHLRGEVILSTVVQLYKPKVTAVKLYLLHCLLWCSWLTCLLLTSKSILPKKCSPTDSVQILELAQNLEIKQQKQKSTTHWSPDVSFPSPLLLFVSSWAFWIE